MGLMETSKDQEDHQVSKLLGTMNVCTACNGNPFNRCQDIQSIQLLDQQISPFSTTAAHTFNDSMIFAWTDDRSNRITNISTCKTTGIMIPLCRVSVRTGCAAAETTMFVLSLHRMFRTFILSTGWKPNTGVS